MDTITHVDPMTNTAQQRDDMGATDPNATTNPESGTTVPQTATSEANAAQVITLTQAELDAQIAAAKQTAVAEYQVKQYAADRASDEDLRREPLLRAGAAKLIESIRDTLQEIAAETVKVQRGDFDPFIQDRVADQVLWLVAEYLMGAQVPTDDNLITRAHQMGEWHITHHFDVERDQYGRWSA